MSAPVTAHADEMADRIIARATGQGGDPTVVKSMAGNPFLNKPRAKDAERDAVHIKPNSATDFETARQLLAKRIARVVAGQYDVELHFTDGTALMLSLAGNGIEFLITKPPVKKESKP